MRLCYNDITNNTSDSISAAAPEYAEILKKKFSTENMHAKFVDCIVSEKELNQMQEDIENLLADLL